MSRRAFLSAILGAAGLALYLWPALTAPVVLWSDSALDLDWARRGEGIVTPVVSTHHPPKPGYILFLCAALAPGPAEGAERRIVVIQSGLVWLAIAASALLVGRQVGPRGAVALYLLLILCLRLRDASSAVMSEALTAALLLPIVAVLLDPPKRFWSSALLGLASAALFLVRPNAGGAALFMAAVSLALSGRPRHIAPLVLGFVLLWAPFWRATAVPGDPFRGMAPAFITGSVDYGWTAQRENPDPEPPPLVQVQSALANWKATFAEVPADRNRQLAWRALHGLLGTEFYDAGWSPLYARLSRISRIVMPLLTLACIGALLAAPFSSRARAAKTLGLLLFALLVVQSLVLGALPRLALPFLPAFVLCGVVASAGLENPPRRIVAGVLFTVLVGFVSRQPQVLDWEWGRLEASGVRIAQTIPRRALPERMPATLHVRIAPLVVPTNARLELLGPGDQRLPAAPSSGWGQRPFLTIPLWDALLAANREGPVELVLVSRGDYDAARFLIFPVIPPPWAAPARRETSADLSPSTGIPSGSLDWWAHSGTH